MPPDPLQHQAHADLIAQRAADQLRDLLQTVVKDIDPFPPFPGSMFSYGIEIEPAPGGAEDAPDGGRGCIVVGEDGKLYELRIGIDVEQAAAGDPVAMRSEERVPLDDLLPAVYVSYAHAAVRAAVAHLLEAAERD